MNIAKLEECIGKLEGIDPADVFAYEKAFSAFLSISQLPIAIFQMESGLNLFRTRTHFGNELFNRATDISIPDKSLTRSFARCNRPFQPVFYCSENRPTSYMELVQYWASMSNVGDILNTTVGHWVTNRPINLIIVSTPDSDMRVNDFDKYHGTALDSFIEKYSGEYQDCVIRFYRYLFEKFRKPAKDDPMTYVITTAYINLAKMHLGEEVDGVYYPSVPFNGNGVNLALSPHFIENGGLNLAGAMRSDFKVELQENGKLNFAEVNYMQATEITGDVIRWPNQT